MSGYPPEMQESIRLVEATRLRRLKETFPTMSLEEREQVLNAFHPDYIKEKMRAIRVGVSKGQRMPVELADIVEGRPHIGPDFDLSEPFAETDVLVIGGGGAGASAALLAQENGAKVILVTKLRFGDANTMMAQGGIQAADRPNDSPAIHYLDVMGGGHFTNVPELVEALVMDAPFVIKWLEDLGMMFDKEPDGTMVERHGGGTSRMRMHSARDYSGAEIMRTLRDEVRNREEDITVIEFSPAVELVLDDKGQIAGAVVMNLETGVYSYIKAKAVILATGGGGRLHYQGFPTTNHYGATADGVVMAYRVGAPLGYLESMQYHPTGAAFPEQIVGLLVTEKVRGLGAQPVNKYGEQFVYPLEPRDVEAAAFIRECKERGNGIITPTGQPGVWLDSPMIEIIQGPGTIKKNLPAMVRQFGRFGIDITQEPMLVYPTLHYQNGGVRLRADGSTEIPGLFIAGEVSGGVHGHNRLMGNSLLEITVFGRRSGRSAAAYAQQVKPGKPTLAHIEAWNRELEEAGVDTGVISPILLPDYTRRV
ncbi:MAG: succinate dehydrogenase/fumarate reductase flavoprotein subunit [Chloroflexi bacterium]|nr:MAG: succinate dehydrogenase/fumarate reductase flavoprotein subunit [Chloroflexota bacterium]HEY66811.1 FAD-binding protein [Thermoflexia bacterium]